MRPSGPALLGESASREEGHLQPQMSTGDLAGDFGSQLKAIGKCHCHDNFCTKPVTKKSPVAALTLQRSNTGR